jgi:hypothetical protein
MVGICIDLALEYVKGIIGMHGTSHELDGST